MGKGEIACYKQFFLFPQCFQKTCTGDTYKPGLVWEWVMIETLNPLPDNKILDRLKLKQIAEDILKSI